MTINNKFAVIIPIHKFSDVNEIQLFQKALDSINNLIGVAPCQIVIVAGIESVVNVLKEKVLNPNTTPITGVETRVVLREKSEGLSFQAQVNAGVSALTETIEYFTVLEFDDVLRPKYFEHVAAYTEAFPDASVLLPLVEEVNAEGQLLKYSNEVLWTPNFTEKLGELDHEALSGFANFHLTGAVIKKADFLELGGLKESMELTFNYEFLLRATQKGKTVRSIPKVIYTHLDARPGSLFVGYTQGRTALSSEEVRFWFDTAHKESVFTEDRKITYSLPKKGE